MPSWFERANLLPGNNFNVTSGSGFVRSSTTEVISRLATGNVGADCGGTLAVNCGGDDDVGRGRPRSAARATAATTHALAIPAARRRKRFLRFPAGVGDGVSIAARGSLVARGAKNPCA